MGGEAGPDQAPPVPVSNLDAANGFWQRPRAQGHPVGRRLSRSGTCARAWRRARNPRADLPEVVWRTFVLALIVGFPIASTLAWYHGHKGFTHISAGELSIVAVLVLIGAVFFSVAMQPDELAEQPVAVPAASDAASSSRIGGVQSSASSSSARTGNAVLPGSVAVLPFENLSPNPDDAYFAIGIHEQVLARLGKIGGLTVTARPSVVRYAKGSFTIPEIARELKVGVIGGGTVRYADGNVRVTAFLTDAATEAQLWSETYTRPFENSFTIETEIATQIAVALEAKLAPSEQRTLAKQSTKSADAYAYYLRAIAAPAATAGGVGVSMEETAEFQRYLDRALELDPEFALGHAAKARHYAYSLGRPMPRSAGLNPEDRAMLASASAERALALDPEAGLAYSALATVHRYSGRRREAQLAIDKAVALSPNDYQVLFDAAVLFIGTDADTDTDRALAFAQRAARVNPIEGFLSLGLAFAFAGDYDAAAEQFVSRLDYPTMPYEMARIELLRANKTSALEYLREQERRGIRPPAAIQTVAYFYHLLGADNDARRLIGTFEVFAEDYAVGPGDWALAALIEGNQTEALQWLQRAAGQRPPKPDAVSVTLIATNRYSDPVLDQPEFVEVRNRLAR